jgi:hypothetical protein
MIINRIDPINISFDFVLATLYKKKSNKYLPITINVKIKTNALIIVFHNKVQIPVLSVEKTVINNKIGITIKSWNISIHNDLFQ